MTTTTTDYAITFEDAAGLDRRLLGGKGAGLAEMTKIGLPVPPGFIITTEACRAYYARDRRLPDGLMEQVRERMAHLQEQTGKGFGDPEDPLLVSVRSGAVVSMPGMMDTILNLGLNDGAVEGLARSTGNERFALDAYRRLLQLFGSVAMEIDDEAFGGALERAKDARGARLDTELDAEALREITGAFQEIIRKESGRDFPQDPWVQLEMAVEAVFRSWMGKRVVDYRREFGITPAIADGTAANVCTMVFGNMGSNSATGVAFTRDPGTGENVFFGEYLTNAQGEDVVAGIRTPQPLDHLREEMPEQYEGLEEVRRILERHYREPQDLEFTIERSTLYVLQTRGAKMNALARVRTAREMADEGLIDRTEALLRIRPEQLEQLLHPRIDEGAGAEPLAWGIGASPGAASGIAVFDADEAERRGRAGERVVLVREETKPQDIHGFFPAVGIVTSRGGKTSHAAVVARGMGKPCVVGCEAMRIDAADRTAHVDDQRIREGDVVTIDGSTGALYLGEIPTVDPEVSGDLEVVLGWADEARSLGVRANADTPEDAELALEMGAEGIGLCRTERMFNAQDRLPIVREMILASSVEERRDALALLLPMQRADFEEIFRTMAGRPVTVRLLDPPLHEFLPPVESLVLEIERLRALRKNLETVELTPEILHSILESGPEEEDLGFVGDLVSRLNDVRARRIVGELIGRREELLRKVRETTEVNPMLGHRGVRLGISYPEIYRMQLRAILEAAAVLAGEGVEVRAEIMVPQVCTAQELKRVAAWVEEIHAEVEAEHEVAVPLEFGTMIEVVRACMRAGRLAEVTGFFSFGTNDLSQGTFSFSREDAEQKFLPLYNEMQILMDNPFEVLDIKGVGRLMKMAIEWGRRTNPELKLGICGEHAGNPRSIEFCHAMGLDYVSCSPFRLPVARLAAAQARLNQESHSAEELEHPDYPFNVFFPETS
jgi:pyruvate, orthophosphate dikinase